MRLKTLSARRCVAPGLTLVLSLVLGLNAAASAVRPLAWGSNTDGELGNNSTTDSQVPTAVLTSGVLSGKTVTAISAGYYHSLALCSDGTVVAWGGNSYGQLGNNQSTESNVPVTVVSTGALLGKTVTSISAGYEHSLALCSDGTVYAWGRDREGELGTGSANNSSNSVPVAVTTSGVLSGKTVVAVSAGYNFSMALCSDGTIAAWGDNTYGELGNGTTTGSSVPVKVVSTGALSGKTVKAVAACEPFGLALCSDGTVVAWGDNADGELGNGTTTESSVPVAVVTSGVLSGKTVTAISGGDTHSLVLCSDGTLAAWGDNTDGELGDGDSGDSNVPISVTSSGVLSGKRVVAISSGSNHCLALCSDGTAAAWGLNHDGELGDNSTTLSYVPATVSTSGLNAGEGYSLLASGPTALHSLGLVTAISVQGSTDGPTMPGWALLILALLLGGFAVHSLSEAQRQGRSRPIAR